MRIRNRALVPPSRIVFEWVRMAMIAAGRSLAPIRGDAYAEAPTGDCASLGGLLNRTTGMLNVVMSAPGDFEGHVQVFEFGSLRACHISCASSMKVDGSDVIESDWLHGGSVHVLIQLSGAMTVNRLGRAHISLQPDEWCAISHVGRFRAEASGPVEFMLLVIPGDELHSIVDGLAKLSERRVRAQSGLARLFLQLLTEVMAQAPTLDAPGRVSVSNAIIQLFRASILDAAKSIRSPVAHEHLYRRVCEMVESDLGNENLSITFIAQRLNCSKRYLHFLFARRSPQRTLNEYINFQRLSRCRAELLMQSGNSRSIAEIAHRWGFHDPSYFARRFRREYGISPRAFLVNAGQAEEEAGEDRLDRA